MNDEPSQPTNEQIWQRLNFIEQHLREQTQRIYTIEERLGLAQKYQAPAPLKPKPIIAEPGISVASTITETPIEKIQEIAPSPVNIEPYHSPFESKTPEYQSQEKSAFSLEGVNIESLIGGNWFNRIGILAIVIGIGFFLKLAFEREWIGPTGRVALGVFIGIGFLIGGEKLRSFDYKHYAQGLSGGGIAILYLTFFAAFARYGIIGQFPAFALMAMVTATSVLLAARYNAIAIAILGIIGGFLTPVMLSTGVDNQIGLFSYITLLNLGVLAVAYFKQWRILNYLTYGATVLMSVGWYLQWYRPEKLGTTIFFFTVLFVIFALLAVFHNIIHRRPIEYPEISLIFSNAFMYFGASYGLLSPQYHPYLGLFAVVLSAFYLGLGYLTYSRDGEDKFLILTFLGLASLFLTLAIPIQFDQHWVTMAWAIEGVILTWIGLQAKDRTTIRAAVVIFAVACVHWLMFDASDFGYMPGNSFTPLFNRRTFSALALIASLIAAAWLHSKTENDEEESGVLRAIFLAAANVLVILFLSMDINDYFEKQKIVKNYSELTTAESSITEWTRIDAQNRPIEESKQLLLSLLFTLYAGVALCLGIVRKNKWMRFGGFALLTLATVKLIAMNASYFDDPSHTLFFNKTFFAFAALVAALFAGRYFYSRKSEGIDPQETNVAYNILTVAANILAVAGLTLEASGYYSPARNPAVIEGMRDFVLSQRLSLSIIWMLYGGAMLVAGLARSRKLLRVMGLILLAVTTLKVFLLDLSSLDKIYRIISFIFLGAILLGVSFLYQRWQKKNEADEGS